jgi:toxin YoeB
MDTIFLSKGWEDYQYWIDADLKLFSKINKLIKECQRTPFEGIGKPEPLKNELSGWWSRRIDREHRLVYRVKDGVLEIAQCRHHY